MAASRALTAVPAHACFGAFMGDYYARRRFGGPGGHRPAASLVLLVPLTLHGLYDAPLFLLNVPSIGDNGLFATLLVLAFVALLGWMFQRTRRMVARLRARQDATAREELAAAARTLPPARPRD